MHRYFVLFCLAVWSPFLFAQEGGLLDLLPEEAPEVEYATAGFKTTRIINGHSFEMNSLGVLDFKISHRFGRLSQGAYDFFGLDAASIRLGLDYGITPWLNIGVGRSSFEKIYDGFVKLRGLRQQTGKRNIPVSALWVSDMAVVSQRNANTELEPYLFTHRLNFTHQLIVGRKFNDTLSFQLMPTVVHRNFVLTRDESNTVMVMGVGGRVKLTKRVALNVEYYYVPPDQLDYRYTHSLSLGFDIETGGHVFQLHLTNSTAMVENAFLTQTTGKWLEGDIHFGFNVSRVFTVYRPK
jgi:opacity protein-like surface antigen